MKNLNKLYQYYSNQYNKTSAKKMRQTGKEMFSEKINKRDFEDTLKSEGITTTHQAEKFIDKMVYDQSYRYSSTRAKAFTNIGKEYGIDIPEGIRDSLDFESRLYEAVKLSGTFENTTAISAFWTQAFYGGSD